MEKNLESTVSNPVHPGEFIRDMYLAGSGVSDAEFARYLGVSASAVSRLLSCKSELSIDMAMRLSRVCGRSPESWMMIQVMYNVHQERKMNDSPFRHLKRIPSVIDA